MKLLIFLTSILFYSCASKPVVEVDLTKWYNTVKVSDYDDSNEYFSFIGSNLSGKHFALMNFDKKHEKLVVTFALNDGQFDFQNNDLIKVRFDNGREEEFRVHNSSAPNMIHIFQDDKFAQELSKTKRLRVELKIKDHGVKTFDWKKVNGLQKVYYENKPEGSVKI